MTSTIASAKEFQTAYDHYNVVLFNSQLSQCLITLQRVTNCLGYSSSKKFVVEARVTVTDEIAMNPEFFAGNPIIQTLQTWVHEMVHLWQYHLGTPSRRTYRNRVGEQNGVCWLNAIKYRRRGWYSHELGYVALSDQRRIFSCGQRAIN